MLIRYSFVIWLLASLLYLSACKSGVQNPKQSDPAPKNLLSFKLPNQTIDFEVEIRRTEGEKQIGLMFRKSLDRDKGMLFIWNTEAERPFWMKDTQIPLDMIFLDKHKKIVGIIHNAEPLTLTQRTVNKLSQYVLEINAGLSKKLSIKEGLIAKWNF